MDTANNGTEQVRLNTLIPMEDASGNRSFVNSWDVSTRKAEGWKVIGDLNVHTASTRAPVDALVGGAPAAATAEVTKPADPMVERARVRAILKAADDDQEALADKIVAEGKPEAEALQALAADRVARKKKSKGDATAAAAPAPVDAAPPKV
jgi:hypothetical protein